MRKGSVLAGLALALGLAPALAQENQQKPPVDPQAIAALERMGTYLRTLKSFRVDAETSTDDVLDSGQKVQHSGTARLVVRRPDRLRADVVSDRQNQQLIYDGHTFTAFQPRTGYYAQFDAPPTIKGLIEVSEQKYGIDFPLADLFYWGTEKSRVKEIKSATFIGTSTIKGNECDHYAFHQSDVDWEICIQRGAQALPRKLVVTTTSEPSQPQYTATLSWDLAPALEERMFTFAPPASAHRIEFDTATEEVPSFRRTNPPAKGEEP